jgi:hypothetical protein
VPPRKGPYGAGWSEKAGRVIAPRKVESRGHKAIPQGGFEEKADGVHAPEGSSPGCVLASIEDTTGVCERGRSSEGERGNVGEPPVSLTTGPEWGTG